MTDGVAWSPFNLPADPPWQVDEAARGAPPVETGTRRRLMHPPPRHIRAGPPGLEFAGLESAQIDLRRRLEEQNRDDRRRDGQVVYDDTAPYQVRGKWDEAEGGDANALSSVRTLQFESRFESGNLQRAVKVGPSEYDLYLRPDKGCGHVQWYYFMVRNMKHGVPYVFNIVNFVKNKSLYNAGLRPLTYSEKEARGKRGGIGWHRTGSKCVYYQRGARYALTFETTFKYDGDTCFFAHCYPYTYSDGQLFLASLLKDPERSKSCKRSELCRSLAGNVVDLLEIGEDVHAETPATKPSILLSARVHPGETQGSWAIQSCIEFLTSDLPEAKLLRSRFTIYVVPMLNPDGVISGHYRCSLSGHDLNRVWANPDKTKHPCIWHIRDLVRLLSSQGLIFFCDFHGHSVKKNAFMYGCSEAGNQSYKPTSSKSTPSTAMFPLLLEEISPAFSFNDCNFRVQRSKMNTGRVVVNRSFGVANSYTIEISFLGHAVNGTMVHFKIEDLEKIGRDFAVALVKYHFPTQYELTQPARSGGTNLKGSAVQQGILTSKQMGTADYGCGHGTDAEDANGLDSQIAAQASAATRIGVVSHPHACQSEQKSVFVAQHGEFSRPKAFAQQEDPTLQKLASRLGNTCDSSDESKVNMQLDLEASGFHDNFIRSLRSRRETIAQEIRQCEEDLAELSPTGAGRVIARSNLATLEAVSRSPALSAKDIQPAEAANGCDESEQDSDDSSDGDMAQDSEMASNAGTGAGVYEKGEGASDVDSDSSADPEVTKLIASAKAGQPTLRVGLSPMSQTLVQDCGSGFLPKLDVKRLGGNPREGPVSSGLRSHVASIRDQERKVSPSGSPRRYPRPTMPTRVDSATAAQHVMAALQAVGLTNAAERSKAQHERSQGDNLDSEDPSTTAQRLASREVLIQSRCEVTKGARLVREREESRAEVVPGVNDAAPAGAEQQFSGPLSYDVEERLERKSSSGPIFALSAAPKIAHLCAAVEGSRHSQFPVLSSSESPQRPAKAGEGMRASRGDFAPLVLKFAAAGVGGTRSLDSSPSHLGGRRIALSVGEEDLYRLALRTGPPSDGEFANSADAREAEKKAVYDGDLGKSAGILSRLGSGSPASASSPHPPPRVDPHYDPGSRGRQMRVAKGRPGRFPQTMLARPGAPKSKSRGGRSRETAEELNGLAIISTAKEYEDAMQAGAQSRTGRRAIQTTQSCATRRTSQSPRRLAPGLIDASSLYDQPQLPTGRISTRDKLTFIRMLSVLKNKPD